MVIEHVLLKVLQQSPAQDNINLGILWASQCSFTIFPSMNKVVNAATDSLIFNKLWQFILIWTYIFSN